MCGTTLLLALRLAGPPCGPVPSAPLLPLESVLLDPGIRSGFMRLFAGAEFGFARFERAAWLVRGSAGPARFLPWPFTGLFGRSAWPGGVPEGALAVVHTHPNGADPRPSNGDTGLARRLGMPVLTLSRSSLWIAWPDGRMGEIPGTGPFGWANAARSLEHAGSPGD